jgi:hypothetical protein
MNFFPKPGSFEEPLMSRPNSKTGKVLGLVDSIARVSPKCTIVFALFLKIYVFFNMTSRQTRYE